MVEGSDHHTVSQQISYIFYSLIDIYVQKLTSLALKIFSAQIMF